MVANTGIKLISGVLSLKDSGSHFIAPSSASVNLRRGNRNSLYVVQPCEQMVSRVLRRITKDLAEI